MTEKLVNIKESQALTSSLIIAKRFNKSHTNVLANIRELIDKLTLENLAVRNYFISSSYMNTRNRKYKTYDVTRDGFSLLAMGFTGMKAFKFKTRFINAFNRMESELKKISLSRKVGIETRKLLTDTIQESGENERMHGHAFSTYSKLAYKLAGISYEKKPNFRDSLSSEQIERVKNIESMIKALIQTGKQYKEIKSDLEIIFQAIQ
jgi:Rha family phage regulatory protein